MELSSDIQELVIREATSRDKDAIKGYIVRNGRDSKATTFGDLMWHNMLEMGDGMLEKHLSRWGNHVLLAISGDSIIGLGIVATSGTDKFRHIGELTLSIREDYWNLGVGRELIQRTILECKEKGVIRKLNLRVREDQESCRQLYKSLGFYEEGTLSRDVCISGMFFSSILYGRNID